MCVAVEQVNKAEDELLCRLFGPEQRGKDLRGVCVCVNKNVIIRHRLQQRATCSFIHNRSARYDDTWCPGQRVSETQSKPRSAR